MSERCLSQLPRADYPDDGVAAEETLHAQDILGSWNHGLMVP